VGSDPRRKVASRGDTGVDASGRAASGERRRLIAMNHGSIKCRWLSEVYVIPCLCNTADTWSGGLILYLTQKPSGAVCGPEPTQPLRISLAERPPAAAQTRRYRCWANTRSKTA
jgi:hypothetical protein